MWHTSQQKTQKTSSLAKPAKASHKATNPPVAPSKQPVWTLALGDHPPVSLQANEQPSNAVIAPCCGHDFSQRQVYPAVPGMIQPKLAISQPGDPGEQEADRVAEQVMRLAEPLIMDGGILTGQAQERFRPQISPTDERELHGQVGKHQTLQPKDVPGRLAEDSSARDAYISSLRGSGQPLPAPTRAFMESRFGHDFSQVHVHTNERAAASARAMNALAYTVGQDIVFGAGQYTPETMSGQRLLAHELVHVLQQGAPGMPHGAMMVQRQVVHMASGRYVGNIPGTENNLREEVMYVMTRLFGLGKLTAGEFLEELSTVAKQVQQGSNVPDSMFPLTVAAILAIETNDYKLKKEEAKLILKLQFSDVGLDLPNKKNEVLNLQEALFEYGILNKSEYDVESMKVIQLTSDTVNWTAIPKTILGIPKLKLAYLGGLIGPEQWGRLKVASETTGMLGTKMIWHQSEIGSGTTFEMWASAQTEQPLPALSTSLYINCWEMVLLAAYRAGVITWKWINDLYHTTHTPDWYTYLVNILTRGSRVRYRLGDPHTPKPHRGQIVFFNGSDHVALANGMIRTSGLYAGSPEVITFWPPPFSYFYKTRTGKTYYYGYDTVKIMTIDELSNYFNPPLTIEFATPPW